jgi:hypothetical protein
MSAWDEFLSSVSVLATTTTMGAPSFRLGVPRRGEGDEALKLLISASFKASAKLSFAKLNEP